VAKKILVLGGVLPALSLIRRLECVAEDLEVICHVDDVIVFSRIGMKHQYNSLDGARSLVEKWIETNKCGSDQWLIIPCSEFFVGYVGLFINNGFDVFSSPQDVLDVFADKKTLYSWLSSLGIHVGDFFDLDAQLFFDNSEKYLLKVSRVVPGYKSEFKTKVVETPNELQRAVEKIPYRHRGSYVIQRLYPDTENISYGGVWVSGKEIASVIVQQLRQYPKGVTSAVRLHKDSNDVAHIRSVISRIAAEKDLNGFVELEFVKNEQGLIPIDLNARLWGWSNFLFYNYPSCAESIVKGDRIALRGGQVDSWSNLWRDFPAIFKGKGRLFQKLYTVFLLLASTKRIDFISYRDIKPEILSFIKRVI